MNCKPGDLAVIVRGDDFPDNIGKLVQVVGPSRWGVVSEWECAPLSPLTAYVIDESGETLGTDTAQANVDIEDASLRPIRDPGEDAKDESLEWLPVPSVKEPA